jgi:hypothetical protein
MPVLFPFSGPRSFLAKVVHIQTAALNNALKSSDGNILGPVNGHDDLASIDVTPFLMTPGLANQTEPMLSQGA